MRTENLSFGNIFSVDPERPDAAIIARAARLLREGSLVSFPTETVYGLGGNALDTITVARIFEVKGRPTTNPVIVHIHNVAAARKLVTVWPDEAERLAAAFWPGPMTLVLPKHKCIPDIITAGGPTVAIRIPAHPVALALLEAADLPIAGPSANRSSRISPVRAEHVARAFTPEEVPMILDAGQTKRGIESVVIDMTNPKTPRILRPGVIAPNKFSSILGIEVTLADATPKTDTPAKSPGLMTHHYAPNTPMILCDPEDAARKAAELTWDGRRVYRLMLPETPDEAAAQLYEILHEIDTEKIWDVIVADRPPPAPEWRGVLDRMIRASAPKTEN